MIEHESKTTPVEAAKKPRLPDRTRAFVQHAFAHGAAEGLDEREKWLLARYVVDDQLTLEKLKRYAGVTTREGARILYSKALTVIWENSPAEVQRQFPKEEVLTGKRGNYETTAETKARMSAAHIGRKHSAEHRANIGKANIGHEVTPETRGKISAAHLERHRREREKRQ